MQEIIDWLKTVEQLACALYSEAAVFFEADEEFSAFLDRLAGDEMEHFDLVDSASGYLGVSGIPVVSAITLNRATRERAEMPLKRGYHLLLEQSLTKEAMIDTMVDAEFSELNAIFLYALTAMRGHSKTFQRGAAVIQAHEDRIKRFLEALPDGLKPTRDIRQLPDVWRNRFLVVDDEEPLRILLSRVLGSLGQVETATNGEEGLEKTREGFFNVIISDVDMPVMNGLEFYRQAVKEDPGTQAHFAFYSGLLTPQAEELIQEHNLPYLGKPFSLDEFEGMVEKIIHSTSEAM